MKIISMKGLVETASGKICQDDNNSVSYRKKDGKMFSARRCNERDLDKKPYTSRELAIQTSFTTKSQLAATWTKANRVYKKDSNNQPTRVIDLQASTSDYRKMRAAFDAQDKIPTFQAFVWAQIKNGVVVVPDVEVTEPSVTMYTLSVSSNNEDQGTIDASVNKSYASGTEVEIKATPKAGFAFDHWNDNTGGATRTVTMTSDLTLTAYFKVRVDDDDDVTYGND